MITISLNHQPALMYTVIDHNLYLYYIPALMCIVIEPHLVIGADLLQSALLSGPEIFSLLHHFLIIGGRFLGPGYFSTSISPRVFWQHHLRLLRIGLHLQFHTVCGGFENIPMSLNSTKLLHCVFIQISLFFRF